MGYLKDQLRGLLTPPRRADVLFYAASAIDETWIRSTILECRRRKLSCILAVGDAFSSSIAQVFTKCGVRVFQNSAPHLLHRIVAPVVVTASSGVPRSTFHAAAGVIVHMPHSIVSLHMIYPEDAFDDFDVLFAAGPHHVEEFRRLSEYRNLGPRTALAVGYGKFDLMTRPDAKSTSAQEDPMILIAPSWGANGLLPSVGVELIAALLKRQFRVTLRPHPLHVISNDPILLETREKFASELRFCEESPNLPPQSMSQADILMTDYSGTAFEFAWLRQKPTLFVDVPKKIVNSNWEKLGLMPIEVRLREHIGVVVPPIVKDICDSVDTLLRETASESRIGAAIPKFVYDTRPCGSLAADAIENLLGNSNLATA